MQVAEHGAADSSFAIQHERSKSSQLANPAKLASSHDATTLEREVNNRGAHSWGSQDCVSAWMFNRVELQRTLAQAGEAAQEVKLAGKKADAMKGERVRENGAPLMH